VTDYKDTLNLPNTDFPMKGNLANREPEMLAHWEAIGLYRQMREAGVRTAFERLYWDDVEKRPGVYDWSKTDATVERCLAADIKVLMRVGDDAPQFFPDDWYMRDARGTLWRNHNGYGGDDWYTLLSPWCVEAQIAEREFLLKCIDRYAGRTVQLYAGGPHGGEVILPGMIPCYCDEHIHTHPHLVSASADNTTV